MSTAMSKAESNALVVSYDVLGTHVELDLDFVKKYLVRGKAELVSNQELVFFMNTCRQQKLNPLVQGEVYLIKYSKDDPAQMVVGKDAYLRRAFDHPDYLFKNDPRKFTIENPLPFMQYPVQPEGLEMVVPCEARTAGAIIYYPMSMLIATGIC